MDKLMETGTRFEHWNELLDTFRQGVYVIDKMEYPSDGDKEMKKNLATAIMMIERKLSNSAGLNSNFIPEWQVREVFSKEDTREENVTATVTAELT